MSPKYIIHLSDLHIRIGDIIKSRYNEYFLVIDKIINYVSKNYSKESIICVITGDIFHNRNKVEATGIKLFWQLISNLSRLCKSVYLIKGNHDFKQESPDEPDLIGSLLHLQNLKQKLDNVVYMQNTGIYEYDDLIFGTVSIQDARISGSTSGLVDELPLFPSPALQSVNSNKIKIALFHGSLKNREWLKEYDIGLLGDIHVQQIIGSNVTGILSKPTIFNDDVTILQQYKYSKFIAGYAGSTIQQDFGENILGHGFLLWDIEDKTVSCCHINNIHGFITLDTNNSVQIKCAEKTDWLQLSLIKDCTWFPKNVSVRGSNLEKAETHCVELGLIVESGSIFKKREDTTTEKNTLNLFNLEEQDNIIQTLCTADKWINYINQTMNDPDCNNLVEGWQKWLSEPVTLKQEARAKDRLDRIDKRLELYLENQDNQKKKHCAVKILNMKWEWMLCFKNNCFFDFTLLDGNINIINGKNGKGKTSFLECICIGLFGEGFPSRTNKNYTASLINNNKPPHSGAYIAIQIELNKEKYLVRRGFHTQDDKTKIHAASKESYVKDLTSGITLAKGKTAIDKWIDANVGSLDSFLMSGMLTQSVDRDFFNLNSNSQKQMLDKSLNIASHGYMMDLLREVKLAVVSNISLLKDRINDYVIYKDVSKEITETKEKIKNINNKYEQLSNLDFQKSNRYTIEEAKQIVENNKDCYYDTVLLQQLENEINLIPKEISCLVDVNIDYDNISSKNQKLQTLVDNYNYMKNIWGHEPYDKIENIVSNVNIDELEKELEHLINNKPSKPENNNHVLTKFNHDRFKELSEKLGDNSNLWYSPVNMSKYNELISKIDLNVKQVVYKPKPELIKQEWNRDKYNKLSSILEYDLENKEELLKYLSEIKYDVIKHKEYTKELEGNKKIIKGYEEYPFNPECSECARTPWKLHLNDLLSRQNKLVKKLSKMENLNKMEKEIKIIENQLLYMNEIELMLPAIEYQEYQNFKTYEQLSKQLEINEYIELLESQKFEKYNDWIKKYTHIKDQIQNYRNSENYIKYMEDCKIYGTTLENSNKLAILKHRLKEEIKEMKLQQCIYDAKNVLLTYEIKNIERDLLNERINLASLEKDQSLFENQELSKFEIAKDLANSQEKLKSLEYIISALSGYQIWIYKNQVLPIICANVNLVLDAMGLDQDLRLNFKFYNDGNNIDWFLGKTPFERASGFQKFICSLGMRIALSKIGASEIRNKQMFLDEGFTACDTDNLQKVPQFLTGLLTMYDAIVLVTHLEELKDNVDKSFELSCFYNSGP